MPRLFPLAAVAVAITFFAAGCAHSPQPVALQLAPSLPTSEAGHGLPVTVRVVDASDESPMTGPAYDRAKARFPVVGNLTGSLGEQVGVGLALQNFAPTETGMADRSLTITVREFSYGITPGFGVGDIQVAVELGAHAQVGGRWYDTGYRIGVSKRVGPMIRHKHMEDALMDALSSVLAKLFQDRELMSFLSGKNHPPKKFKEG